NGVPTGRPVNAAVQAVLLHERQDLDDPTQPLVGRQRHVGYGTRWQQRESLSRGQSFRVPIGGAVQAEGDLFEVVCTLQTGGGAPHPAGWGKEQANEPHQEPEDRQCPEKCESQPAGANTATAAMKANNSSRRKKRIPQLPATAR